MSAALIIPALCVVYAAFLKWYFVDMPDGSVQRRKKCLTGKTK